MERTSFMAGRWHREIPAQYEAIRRAARDVHADVLVTWILCHGALLAAEALDLPVVVVGFAAHIWAYQDANGEPPQPAARVARTRDMTRDFEKIREEVGLPRRSPRAHYNPLIGSALLLRGAPEFEFPGAVLCPSECVASVRAGGERASPSVELAEVTDHLDRVRQTRRLRSPGPDLRRTESMAVAQRRIHRWALPGHRRAEQASRGCRSRPTAQTSWSCASRRSAPHRPVRVRADQRHVGAGIERVGARPFAGNLAGRIREHGAGFGMGQGRRRSLYSEHAEPGAAERVAVGLAAHLVPHSCREAGPPSRIGRRWRTGRRHHRAYGGQACRSLPADSQVPAAATGLGAALMG